MRDLQEDKNNVHQNWPEFLHPSMKKVILHAIDRAITAEKERDELMNQIQIKESHIRKLEGTQ